MQFGTIVDIYIVKNEDEIVMDCTAVIKYKYQLSKRKYVFFHFKLKLTALTPHIFQTTNMINLRYYDVDFNL